jgi:hypothetical protein
VAKEDAASSGYLNRGQETRDFIQGWLDGYVTANQQIVAPADKYVVQDPNGSTNLHKDSWTNSRVIGRLKNGETVIPESDPVGGWFLVRTSKGEGWIYGSCLKPANPAARDAEVPAPTQQQAPDTTTQIKDLRVAIVAKWNKLPEDVKARIKASPDLKNLETAFNQAPKGSDEKLQALQKVSDYLDSQSTGGEGNLDLTGTPAPASATSTDHNFRAFYFVRDKPGVHGKSKTQPYEVSLSGPSEEAVRANILQQEPNAVQIEINQMPDSD